MKKREETRCFTYLDDNKGEVEKAHRDSVVAKLVDHVLKHLELLDDLSLLLLTNTSTFSPKSQKLLKTYREISPTRLNAAQEQLGQLLDRLYATPYQDTIDARRGVVLERLIHKAVEERISNWKTEKVVVNAKSIARSMLDKPVNGYSVDIAACFSEQQATEFYACKLNAEFMPAKDLTALKDIGAYFKNHCVSVKTAFCCLQPMSDLDPDTIRLIKSFAGIDLITTETIPSLIK